MLKNEDLAILDFRVDAADCLQILLMTEDLMVYGIDIANLQWVFIIYV
jgi:hypothetical protein